MKINKNAIMGFGCVLLLTSGCLTERVPEHLIYYSKLDSEADITNPTVGPTGSVDGAQFVEGVKGNALFAPGGVENTVTIPFVNGLPEKGCIEFDAKLETTTDFCGQRADPYLFVFSRKPGKKHDLVPVMNMSFSANNWWGGSGLSFLGEFNYVVSSHKPEWAARKYSDVLGKDGVNKWHHYKLVWNVDGLANLNGDIVAVYIDGKLFKSGTLRKDRIESYRNFYFKEPVLLHFTADDDNHGQSKTPHLIDEFKVWDTDTPEE